VLLQTHNAAGVHTPFQLHAIPQEFLAHAKRGRILEQIGLTPQAIALGIVEDITALADDRAGDRAPVDADQTQ
jgi:1-deoxy-D-xylulose-5-phosphate synthase